VDLEENYQFLGKIIRGGSIKKPDITVELLEPPIGIEPMTY
jgi:hypothetical protein